MARKPLTEYERKMQKAQKRLQAVNFTPLASRNIASILLSMAEDSPIDRKIRLRVFSEIVEGK